VSTGGGFAGPPPARLSRRAALRSGLGAEVLRSEHLADLGLALPAPPVLLVQLDEPRGRLDGLFLRVDLYERVTADNLPGIGVFSFSGAELGLPPVSIRSTPALLTRRAADGRIDTSDELFSKASRCERNALIAAALSPPGP
jgi:hypothetical protein